MVENIPCAHVVAKDHAREMEVEERGGDAAALGASWVLLGASPTPPYIGGQVGWGGWPRGT